MRKTIRTILALGMEMALCCGFAFATSKTSVAEIRKAVDGNGKSVQIASKQTTIRLTEEEASEIILSQDAQIGKAAPADLKVISVRDLTADTLPVTITFSVDGGKPLYVFRYEDGHWKLAGKGKNGTATVTFNDLSPVGLVLGTDGDAETGSKSGATAVKSYQTGEPDTMADWSVIVLAVLVFGATVFMERTRVGTNTADTRTGNHR